MTVADLPLSVSRTSCPELLVPAGDWDAMRAAVANGADAVYFGLELFNARHRATNFSAEELPRIMRYLHDHNVKGFLTFNTLIFSDELEQACDYIRTMAGVGVDAVIVQDLGLARLIRALAPGLAIHGSTQMTLTEPRGIEFVRALGVKRVVLARELSVADIRKIAAATDMPLEVFIHGALCVAYSGQCLTSESLGGRSANRGQCAQACRLPYDLIVDGLQHDMGDKTYLLSPQDLAAHDLVGDLAQAGVFSLKIEGRLKSAHYVAATTQTYRQALEAVAKQEPFQISSQQRADLEQTFSRGFSHGFLDGVNHQELVTARFPKSRGLRIGTVSRILPRGILITVDQSTNTLKPGDGIVFDQGHPEQDEQGGRLFAVKPIGKNQIEIELGHGDVNLSAIAAGSIVWKTDDPALRKRLEHSFSRDVVVRRIPLAVKLQAHVGEPLRISFSDGGTAVEVQSEQLLETAQKFPVTAEIVQDQLGRLGDSPFELGELQLDVRGNPMVPKSLLNDLRRQAVHQLLQLRSNEHAIGDPHALQNLRDAAAHQGLLDRQLDSPARILMLVRSLEQLDAVLNLKDANAQPLMVYCDFEDIRQYRQAIDRCRAAGIPVALATVRVIKPGEEGLLQQIADLKPDAVLVRNLAAVSFFQQMMPNVPLIGDYSLNIANELTANIFKEAGLLRMVPSYDLNWRQLAAMFTRFPVLHFEAVIHQHMPMFHLEHCVFAHTLSTGKDFRDCGRPCEQHKVELRDRVGESHPLLADVGCRNTVFNAKAQSAADFIPQMLSLGLRYFRIELLRESGTHAAEVLRQYAALLTGKTSGRSLVRSLAVLNQLGVTSGTFDRE